MVLWRCALYDNWSFTDWNACQWQVCIGFELIVELLNCVAKIFKSWREEMAGQEWWDPAQEKKGGPMKVNTEQSLFALWLWIICHRNQPLIFIRPIVWFWLEQPIYSQVEVPQLDVLLRRDPYLTDHQVDFTWQSRWKIVFPCKGRDKKTIRTIRGHPEGDGWTRGRDQELCSGPQDFWTTGGVWGFCQVLLWVFG